MARTKNAGRSASDTAPAPVAKKKVSGWGRSKFNNAEHRNFKKLGLLLNGEKMALLGDEAAPTPPEGFQVMFTEFLVRVLSAPIHEFLHGLLFVYGIQLHQLTPNSILHVVIFITLYECFLGIHPHWGLWKRFFVLRWNNTRNAIYNVAGVCISVRPESRYFDLKLAESIQGWRNKWLYVKDEPTPSQQYNLAAFNAAGEPVRRQSWDL